MAARRRSRAARRTGRDDVGTATGSDSSRARPIDWATALLANALILSPLLLAWWLQAGDEQRYYLTTQEDGWVEWATFWSFLWVAPLSVAWARRRFRRLRRFPWFPLGVGLFCAFVAMEEISWGQRVFGYRPPDYFLAENFQQELNLHNVVDTTYRKLALMAVVLGYGVLLPLAARLRPSAQLLDALGIVAPAASLAPSFLAIFLVYEDYPWKHTGEWVELSLGFGFLFVPLLAPTALGWTGRRAGSIAVLAAWILTFLSGALTAVGYQRLAGPDPLRVQEAERELQALSGDFANGFADTDCNLHKRLYTFVVELGQSSLRDGSFGRLSQHGLPSERGEFFIDPWNSPYWLRDRCEGGRRKAFVYSFGPNRRRDSSRTDILGDDIGVVFFDGPRDAAALDDDD